MTFHKIGYCSFDVTMETNNKKILVAKIRTPLIGLDNVTIDMCFPFNKCASTTLDMTQKCEEEMLETAKRMILKKLYKLQNDIWTQLQSVEIKHKDCPYGHTVGDYSQETVYVTK